MLHRIEPVDEPRLIGVTEVATLHMAQAALEQIFGFPPRKFDRRARQSREIGARLVKIGGVRRFLDELPEDADAPDDAVECGPACQMALDFDES